MDFDHPPIARRLLEQLRAFMDEHVYPSEAEYHRHVSGELRWQPAPCVERLKAVAREAGLWNLWRPKALGGTLTTLEYAPLCEVMGRVSWAPEVFNCSAPDTGNMETILRYGTPAQAQRWGEPLLEGTIRSAFLMTEPDVASSDATNIRTRIRRDGDRYVIDGVKWWSSGAGDQRCAVYIVMGKTDPDHPSPHAQQSMILVPADAAGVTVRRHLPVFGYDEAPHGHMEVALEGVSVPVGNLLLGEGRGFEIAQGRLGPGRIHHCMRLVGQAERALEMMCRRASRRVAFGRPVADHGVTRERIAESRILIDAARQMVLHAAWRMDTAGNKAARKEIAMIKVFVPNVACRVIDWAIQVHGAAGVSDDFGLALMYAQARTLRLADGPDEVHREAIARLELAEQAAGGTAATPGGA
jgi:acyl-CoA dehydrogenase